jgi:hypothetical protein
MVSVGCDDGAVFTVVLPGCLDVPAGTGTGDSIEARTGDGAKPSAQFAGTRGLARPPARSAGQVPS